MIENKNILFIFLLPLFLFSQKDLKYYEEYMPTTSCEKENLIHYNYYSVSFCNKYQLSEWSIYLLPDTLRDLSRGNLTFKMPPNVYKPGVDISTYYKYNVWDKGHMSSAGDLNYDQEALEETFFYTNCVPRHSKLNRGIWSQLEGLMRKWAQEKKNLFGEIIVIVGWGTKQIDNYLKFDGSASSEIREDEVYIPIPKFFFRVFVDIKNNRSIAFLIPNNPKDIKKYERDILPPLDEYMPQTQWGKKSTDLTSFVISIDSLESLTGLDFFYKLPEKIEMQLELNSGNK